MVVKTVKTPFQLTPCAGLKIEGLKEAERKTCLTTLILIFDDVFRRESELIRNAKIASKIAQPKTLKPVQDFEGIKT